MILVVVKTSWQVDQYEYISHITNKEVVYICAREDCISYLKKYHSYRKLYDFSDIFVLQENLLSLNKRVKYYYDIAKRLKKVKQKISFIITDKRWNGIDLTASIVFRNAKIVQLVHGFADTNYGLMGKIVQYLVNTVQNNRVSKITHDLNIPASIQQTKVDILNQSKTLVLFSSGLGRYDIDKHHTLFGKVYTTITRLIPDYQIIIKYKSGEERIKNEKNKTASSIHSFSSLINEYNPKLIASHKSSNTCIQAILLGIDLITYDHELSNVPGSDKLSLFMDELIQSHYSIKIADSIYLIKTNNTIINMVRNIIVLNVSEVIDNTFSK